MKKVFGYIRVSTAKQGEGVSLIEQKEAISRYAEKYNLDIIQWFEEKETAAKQGRPLFTKMMKLLRERKGSGVVIHKIDRSARNLRDWADLGNLIDQGVEVHFAHESLDLQARGGRLSADIQAVIAADYIRNLRQEAIKGIYGRLKQGIYPFQAPTGYVDTGKGKVKAVDPIQGPLVKKVFEYYATKSYTLESLTAVASQWGLRNQQKNKITCSNLSAVLRNPFYMGIIRVKGMVFKGRHEALISPDLFKRVQAVLSGKIAEKTRKHEMKFRKLIRCEGCGYSLIGEVQKGNIYYRCHTKGCITKGFRDTTIEHFLLSAFASVQLLPEETKHVQGILEEVNRDLDTQKIEFVKSSRLQLAQIQQRMERLTDCYIEGGLDKETYEKRKENLLVEAKEKELMAQQFEDGKSDLSNEIQKFLELASSLKKSYEMGNAEEKRQLVELATSNLAVNGKKLMITMRSPFLELSKRCDFLTGAPIQGSNRKKNGEPDIIVNDTTSDSCEDVNKVAHQKPLTKEQLKNLILLLHDKAQKGEFPVIPEEREYFDDS